MVDSEQDFLWPHACMHHTFTRILVRIYNWKTIVFSQIFLSHLFCLLQLVGYFVCVETISINQKPWARVLWFYARPKGLGRQPFWSVCCIQVILKQL